MPSVDLPIRQIRSAYIRLENILCFCLNSDHAFITYTWRRFWLRWHNLAKHNKLFLHPLMPNRTNFENFLWPMKHPHCQKTTKLKSLKLKLLFIPVKLKDDSWIQRKKSAQRHGPRPIPIEWYHFLPPFFLIGHYHSLHERTDKQIYVSRRGNSFKYF